MKKIILVTFLFCLIFTWKASGQTTPDLPKTDQSSIAQDSNAVKFYHTLADGSYLKNPDAALGYAYKGLETTRKAGDAKTTDSLRLSIGKCYQDLIDAAVKRYDYVHAYQFEIRLSQNRDSLIHEASSGQISDLQSVFESDKKKLQDQITGAQKEVGELGHKLVEQEERESRNLMISLSLSAFFLILLFFLIPGYLLGKALKKAHALKPVVAENIELLNGVNLDPPLHSETKVENKTSAKLKSGGVDGIDVLGKTRDGEDLQSVSVIEKTKAASADLLALMNNSLLSARKIQQSLFTGDGLLKQNLPDHFILDKPSEVLSGDFCWAIEPLAGSFYLCLADCKGHGIPGALRSVLFTNFLNETLADKKPVAPDAILSQVHERIILALNPERAVGHPKEGMDAVLCLFDLKGGWLRFSCANNPLWLIRNGELKEFTADDRTVGKMLAEEKPFRLQTLGLRKGDCIYLFSNGFAKQTNPEGEKFGYQRMKELLLVSYSLPMAEQKEKLNQSLSSWQNKADQVDDILVMGIRI